MRCRCCWQTGTSTRSRRRFPAAAAKTDPQVMESFRRSQPSTALVPRGRTHDVPVPHLNGSNAHLPSRPRSRQPDRPSPHHPDRDRQWAAVRTGLTPRPGLVLASAERADLLVDFSDLAPARSSRGGTRRRLRSTAYVDQETPALRTSQDCCRIQVLRIRVTEGRRNRRTVPLTLVSGYRASSAAR